MSAQDLQNLENAEFKEAFDYFDKVKTIWQCMKYTNLSTK